MRLTTSPLRGTGKPMKDLITQRMLAFTIPLVFVLVLLGTAFRDRTLDPTVAGGLIAILGSVVALFAAQSNTDGTKDQGGTSDTPEFEFDEESKNEQEKN